MYERFIARQPILDEKLKLFGYELLFRARDDTRAGADPQATAQLIVSSTMLFDWETLLDGASAFINFGKEELVSGAALLLPRLQTIIELPPNLNYDEDLIQGIKNLRLAGYRVALDGYARQPELERVLRYMNFVKVDFRETPETEVAAVRAALGKFETKVVAKKIETWKEFERAKNAGYSYFQGHFFLEPQVLKRKELAGNVVHSMELLRLVHRRPMDIPRIEEVLKQEPALMYKLLRFLNSPLMARPVEVKSVHNAIALLGEDEFRRWASVVAVLQPSTEKPNELVRTGLTRAFFCEALARVKSRGAAPFEYFLVGLFSVMNALLDRPLADIAAEIAVNGKVRDALTGAPNDLRYALDAALGFEQGKWDEFTAAMDKLEMSEQDAPACQAQANKIVKQLQV